MFRRFILFCIFQYCRINNLEGMNDCLSRGVDVNTKGELLGVQRTALMHASGHPAIVSRLVQVPGLDINYQDEDCSTAAHLVSLDGRTECVRILAETDRVDWNKTDNWGCTPLLWALEKGHSDIVDIIVQQSNIDYNVKTSSGETLAQKAVIKGNVKSVETLAAQEKCQCWNVPDRDGDTPVFKALKKDKMDIFQLLLKCPRVDLNMKDKKGDSLIMVALKTDKIDVVKLMLQHSRVDLSIRDSQGASLEKIARYITYKGLLLDF